MTHEEFAAHFGCQQEYDEVATREALFRSNTSMGQELPPRQLYCWPRAFDEDHNGQLSDAELRMFLEPIEATTVTGTSTTMTATATGSTSYSSTGSTRATMTHTTTGRLWGFTTTYAPIEYFDDQDVDFAEGAEAEVEVRRSPFEYVPEKSNMGRLELEYRMNFKGEMEAWHPLPPGASVSSYTAFNKQGHRCYMVLRDTGWWETHDCGVVASRPYTSISPEP